MNVDNLITQITDSIQRHLGNRCFVSPTKVTKNNGLVLNGLVFQKEGTNICLTVYIDEFLERLSQGASMETAIQRILTIYQENDIPENIDMSAMTVFKTVKDRIIFQLVNTEKNIPMLKEIPSVPFLDFSIIFKILIGSSAESTATGTIGNTLMKIWNIGTDELYEAAKANTPVLMPPELEPMEQILADLGKDTPIDDLCKIYVLSNKQRLHGCGCILYPHVLENFAESIRSDLFILPSSLHEVLLVPFEEETDADALVGIVREVNKHELSQEDFLSDHVYRYSRKTKNITIAR